MADPAAPSSSSAEQAARQGRGLHGNMVSGAAWKATSQTTLQVVQIVTTIVLSRILGPHQFGLVAMVTVFSSLIFYFTDLSFSAALVQRPEITEAHKATAFWTAVAGGTLVTLIGIAISPLVADFYNTPAVEPLFCGHVTESVRARARQDTDRSAPARHAVPGNGVAVDHRRHRRGHSRHHDGGARVRSMGSGRPGDDDQRGAHDAGLDRIPLAAVVPVLPCGLEGHPRVLTEPSGRQHSLFRQRQRRQPDRWQVPGRSCPRHLPPVVQRDADAAESPRSADARRAVPGALSGWRATARGCWRPGCGSIASSAPSASRR